jgi:hypothetical protein
VENPAGYGHGKSAHNNVVLRFRSAAAEDVFLPRIGNTRTVLKDFSATCATIASRRLSEELSQQYTLPTVSCQPWNDQRAA